jgi:hypothetical protein
VWSLDIRGFADVPVTPVIVMIVLIVIVIVIMKITPLPLHPPFDEHPET